MKVKNLSFRLEKKAGKFFNNLNFELAEGQMHALHGKNGIGKSVLLQLLAGNPIPQGIVEGSVHANGGIHLVNQRFDQMISDQFSFAENLQLANLPRFPNPFARMKPVAISRDLVERFHIDTHLPVKKLSGGQRQILALTMALQQEAKFLLLDEPTSTLDEQNAQMVFEFLESIPEKTFLIVCHDRELINRYAKGTHLHLALNALGERSL